MTVTVPLGERQYEILIGAGVLSEAGMRLGSLLGDRALAIISNPTVFDLYGRTLRRSLVRAGFRPIHYLMGDGERYKTLRTVEAIHRHLAAHRLDRSSAIIAFGGGVVGDVAGFVAATFMRGIAYVQLPTTLLAAIDSSIGGKTGVNLPEGKNLVGAFYQPRLVITDVRLLRSLPTRELKAGLYEAIKYGVIADAELFDFIRLMLRTDDLLDESNLTTLIARCCRIKAAVVAADERESGYRQILNYGHTFGHALEALTHYRRFKHGEAVAHGMIIAARLAVELGLMDREAAESVESLVRSVGRLPPIADLDARAWLSAMQYDKKVRRKKPTYILPTTIGAVKMVTDIPTRLVTRTLARYIQGR
ncbi:MAG: 3-dehydroquinate synthase [Acidobacteria bacterium]|nr:MAG: 3-dehydroquinate synthase [Acidobacteriota bacterium]